MSDPEDAGAVERPMLRRALRHTLRRVAPEVRVVAEDFLALASPIDLLGVGSEGEWISIRIAREGEAVDLVVHALADLRWLGSRGADLAKLAPGLGLEPTAAPRALLIAPSLAPEIVAAAEAVGPGRIELRLYRCWRERGRLTALVDPPLPSPDDPVGRATPGVRDTAHDRVATPGVRDATPERLATPGVRDATPERLAAPDHFATEPAPGTAVTAVDPSTPRPADPEPEGDADGFRTGLRDADLEHADFGMEPATSLAAASDGRPAPIS